MTCRAALLALALAACEVRPETLASWTVTIRPPEGQDEVLEAARDVAASRGCRPPWGGWVTWVPWAACGVDAWSGCSPATTVGAWAVVVYRPRATETALAYELGHYVSAMCGYGWEDHGTELDAWASEVNAEAARRMGR